MKLLLDTHIALWAIVDDARLPKAARQLIEEPLNEIFVSAASVWEIAIKHALSRGRPTDMPISGKAALDWFRQAGYDLLPITAEHAAAVEALPRLHADPFDRLLVAQALTAPLHFVTHDKQVGAYSDTIILV